MHRFRAIERAWHCSGALGTHHDAWRRVQMAGAQDIPRLARKLQTHVAGEWASQGQLVNVPRWRLAEKVMRVPASVKPCLCRASNVITKE